MLPETISTQDISVYFGTIFVPFRARIEAVHSVFINKFLDLAAYSSKLPGPQNYWSWYLKNKDRKESVRYGKDDNVRAVISDQKVKEQFEVGLCLWKDFNAIYIACLANPAVSISLINDWAKQMDLIDPANLHARKELSNKYYLALSTLVRVKQDTK